MNQQKLSLYKVALLTAGIFALVFIVVPFHTVKAIDCSDDSSYGMACTTDNNLPGHCGSGQCQPDSTTGQTGTGGNTTGQTGTGGNTTGQTGTGGNTTGQTGTGGNTTGQTGVGIQNPLAGAHINTICDLISKIMTIIAELGAIVAVLFIIWSGFLFVVAQGNVEKVKKAKSILFTTIIGTAILVGSSIITRVIVDTIGGVTSAISGSSNGTGICAGSSSSSTTDTSTSGDGNACTGTGSCITTDGNVGQCTNNICQHG